MPERDAFIEELKARVASIVTENIPKNKDMTEDEVADIDAELGEIGQQIFDDLRDDEDE